jgi:proprotein convertase subtilisin/kexin type 5
MNQCLSSCPLGYYNENVLLICEQCNAKCSNCTNYTYCLTCLEGYLDSTNNCVDSCSLGFYAQLSDRTCRLCDLTCSSCSNISTNCITCATGYVLVQLTLSSSMCSTSCSSTEYSINGICYACSSPCLQCTSSTNCVSCIQGTILLQSSQSCVSVCPLSTYESNGICLPCASTCGSCANLTYCLTCTNSSLYVYLGGCYQNCPSQYYSDNFTKMCVECIAPCVTCTAKFTCLSCTEGFLLTGYCYDVCPPGTFSNATTNSCD